MSRLEFYIGLVIVSLCGHIIFWILFGTLLSGIFGKHKVRDGFLTHQGLYSPGSVIRILIIKKAAILKKRSIYGILPLMCKSIGVGVRVDIAEEIGYATHQSDA